MAVAYLKSFKTDGSCTYEGEPRRAWVAVTLHFPWRVTRRQRRHLLSKWVHECRKRSGLALAYAGAIFQHGKAHHAHLTVFGVNERVGFDICDVNLTELEAIWYEVTGLRSFKAAQIDKKESYQLWQRYIFVKNAREMECNDYECIYFNTRMLKAAGVK